MGRLFTATPIINIFFFYFLFINVLLFINIFWYFFHVWCFIHLFCYRHILSPFLIMVYFLVCWYWYGWIDIFSHLTRDTISCWNSKRSQTKDLPIFSLLAFQQPTIHCLEERGSCRSCCCRYARNHNQILFIFPNI